MPRGLSEIDRATWASYARLVSPLGGAPAPLPAAPEPARAAVVPQVASRQGGAPQLVSVVVPRASPAALAVGAAPGGLDASTWTRFRTGKLVAARRLDLHGRTAQAAHVALVQFLQQSAGQGLRCVEVITGRGKGEAGGVIRREFPLWLNGPELRPLVLAAAHPHAANLGSVRLLLRRRR